MLNFCTLFDHNYLSRGLALYQSLKEQCKDSFRLYILATDDIAYKWLSEQKYEDIVVQSLEDIKTVYPVLERLQQERSRGEFNWTLSSFSIQFFLKKFNLESVTYLDADLYFYADPQILFDELDGESVIITPHNYTPKYDQSETSGRYCVQFMYFKNDDGGNKVLEWWRKECENCCCGWPQDGKFGDQKYLDDWLSRFTGIVHECSTLGAGVAPWNICRFEIFYDKNNVLCVQDKITKLSYPVVFFHFHGLKELFDKNEKKIWQLSGSVYDLSNFSIETFYKPYIAKLNSLESFIPEINKNYFVDNRESFSYYAFATFKQVVKRMLKSLRFWKIYKELSYKEPVKNLFIE